MPSDTYTLTISDVGVSTPSAGSVTNTSVAAGAAIAFSKLATLTSGNILVGSSANVPTSVAVTGNVTLSNTGVTTIANDAVTFAKMQNVAGLSILGKPTSGSGDVEEIGSSSFMLDASTGFLRQADATSARSTLGIVDAATGNALLSSGVGVAPAYGKVGLTTHVSGTLPVANGGTGVTTSTGSGANALATSPTLVTPILGTPTSGTLTNCTGLPLTTGVTGTLLVANGGTGVTTSTGSGANALATSPTLVTPILGTPTSGTLTNCTGLPISTGVSGLGTGVATFLATPSSANLAAAVTGETGSGALVFATSPTLVTPILGTPTSGTLTSCTGLPLTTGVTGTLPVANGGTGVTTSTGSGANALATSPTFVTPVLGTPTSGTLTSCTGLPLTTGVTGTLPVANGGTGVTTSTGSGANALATSPTLVTPILGTPTSGTLTNCTGLPLTTGVTGLGIGVPTFLATPSSANLAAAVTGGTGSGALVFATSPTLVTPDLGTPTSGTLTDCTGLPISTGVSGLGTGVATFLATPSSANLAAAVTGETGSGALVFATSPTLVTPVIGAATGTSLAATGAITSSGTAGIGYATGAGGTVTQLTDKATEVTLNKTCGRIIMHDDSLAHGTTVSFTLANSTIAAGNVLILNHVSGGTAGKYLLNAQFSNGSASIDVTNITSGAESEAIVIAFVVIKAVTA